MMWREQLRRVGRPLIHSVARVLRGDPADERVTPAAPAVTGIRPLAPAVVPVTEQADEVEGPTLPPWGILPSQIPPRVELLPGRSSIELRHRSRRIAAWGFSLYIAATAAGFFVGYDPGAVALAAIIVLLVAGATMGLIGQSFVRRNDEENRAGYTVWRQNTLWKPHVDPETGFVIRPAGAPALSEREEADALKRVREIARYLDDR